MFDWLKRLLSDPPAASLPGDVANPPSEADPKIESKDACIDEARKLMQEAVAMLDWYGLPFEEIEGIVGDAVGDYWEEIYGEDEDDDDWFSDEDDDDYDDDGCDCSIDCECPDCSDADGDYI